MKTIKDINYSYDHVKLRLKQRYKLDISFKEFNDLSIALAIDKSKMLIVENNDQEIHQIKFKNKNVIFVYSISRGHITTVLKTWRKS